MKVFLSSLIHRLVLLSFVYASVLPSWAWALDEINTQDRKISSSLTAYQADTPSFSSQVDLYQEALNHQQTAVVNTEGVKEALTTLVHRLLSVKEKDELFALAQAYELGQIKGISKNNDNALRNYRLAITAGHGEAENKLNAFVEVLANEAIAETHNGQKRHQLGNYYYNGVGVQKDYAKAKEWFEKALAVGNQNSSFYLGLIFEYGDGVDVDYFEALKYYTRNAQDKGRVERVVGKLNTQSQTSDVYLYQKGKCCEYGYGFVKDLYAAFTIYKKVIENSPENSPLFNNASKAIERILTCNDGDVLFQIAQMYETSYEGFFTSDVKLALNAYRLAIEAGHGEAENKLNAFVEVLTNEAMAETKNGNKRYQIGYYYSNGIGVQEDYAKAKEWFERSIAFKNAHGYRSLGIMYEKGLSVVSDLFKALEYYYESKKYGYSQYLQDIERVVGKLNQADENDAVIQYTKAMCFEYGYGFNKDNKKALALYNKAAAQNHLASRFKLAKFHHEEKGITQENEVEISSVFKEAAMAGNPQAQFEFAKLIENKKIQQQHFVDTDTAVTIEELDNLIFLRPKKEVYYPFSVERYHYAINYYALAAKQNYPKAKEKLTELLKKISLKDLTTSFYNPEVISEYFELKKKDIKCANAIIKWLNDQIKYQAQDISQWSMNALATLYLDPQFVLKNEKKGLMLLARASLAGYEEAQHNLSLYVNYIDLYNKAQDPGLIYLLAFCYAYGYGVEQSLNKTFDLCSSAAQRGHLDSMYALGEFYSHGFDGLAVNYTLAVDWYQKAAEKEHALSQCALGQCYEYGMSVKKNIVEALRYYELAKNNDNEDATYDFERVIRNLNTKAFQGSIEERFILGILNERGIGYKKNIKAAIENYRIASEQGHQGAQNNLALLLQEQEGFCKNEVYALLLRASSDNNSGAQDNFSAEMIESIRQKADDNDAASQFLLGQCFEKGKGVDQNFERAFHYYKLCADQHDRDAINAMGHLYEKGLFVEPDMITALSYYEKAAKRRHPEAEKNLKRIVSPLLNQNTAKSSDDLLLLAALYAKGISVEQDDNKSLLCFSKALCNNAHAQFDFEFMIQELHERFGRLDDFSNTPYALFVKILNRKVNEGDVSAKSALAMHYGFSSSSLENKINSLMLYNYLAIEVEEKYQKIIEEKINSYELLAQQGDRDACYILGHCFDEGIGVRKNTSYAVELIKKAACAGQQDAKKLLLDKNMSAYLKEARTLEKTLVSPITKWDDLLACLTQPWLSQRSIESGFIIDTQASLLSEMGANHLTLFLPIESTCLDGVLEKTSATLEKNERGIIWLQHNHQFIVDWSGNLTVFVLASEVASDEVTNLRIHNPYGNVNVQSVNVPHQLQVSGKNIVIGGSNVKCNHLHSWAFGDGLDAHGTLTLTQKTVCEVQALHQHQGQFENYGTIQSQADQDLTLHFSHKANNHRYIVAKKDFYLQSSISFINNYHIDVHNDVFLDTQNQFVNQDTISMKGGSVHGIMSHFVNGQNANWSVKKLDENLYIETFENNGLMQGSGNLHVKTATNNGIMTGTDDFLLFVDEKFCHNFDAKITYKNFTTQGMGVFLQEGVVTTAKTIIGNQTYAIESFHEREIPFLQTQHLTLLETNILFKIDNNIECHAQFVNCLGDETNQIINCGIFESDELHNRRAFENAGYFSTDVFTQEKSFVNNKKGADFNVQKTAHLKETKIENFGFMEIQKNLHVEHASVSNENILHLKDSVLLEQATLSNAGNWICYNTVSGSVHSLYNKENSKLIFQECVYLNGLKPNDKMGTVINLGSVLFKDVTYLHDLILINKKHLEMYDYFSYKGSNFVSDPSSKMLSTGIVKLNSQKTLQLYGKYIFGKQAILASPEIVNYGTFYLQKGTVCLQGFLTNHHIFNVDHLFYESQFLENKGTIEINHFNQYLNKNQFDKDIPVQPLLHRLSNNSGSSFAVYHGMFFVQHLFNEGELSLYDGYYSIKNLENKNGILFVDNLFCSSQTFGFSGEVEVQRLLSASDPYVHMSSFGKTVIRSGGMRAKTLENHLDLHLFDGMNDVDLLKNVSKRSRIIMHEKSHFSLKDLMNQGEIISTQGVILDLIKDVSQMGTVKTLKGMLVRASKITAPDTQSEGRNQIIAHKEKDSEVIDEWIPSFLQQHMKNFEIVEDLKVEAPSFRSTMSLTIPYHATFIVQNFTILNHLSVYGLFVDTHNFINENNISNGIHCYGPMNVVALNDINNECGEIQSTGKIILKSINGTIMNGSPILNGQCKSRNGAKIISNDELILETMDGQIDNSYGILYGKYGVFCTFQAHQLINTTAQILSGSNIELTGKKLLNQTGGFYETRTNHTHVEWREVGTSNPFKSSKMKDFHHHYVDVHEHFISEGSEIESTGGDIKLFIQHGLNSGSSICASKKLFINGHQWKDEEDLPSTFINECKTARRADGWTGRKTDTQTIKSVLKAGKHVNVKTGLFTLSGSVNAPHIQINVESLGAIRAGLRQDMQTGDVFINLADVTDQMMKEKSIFQRNLHIQYEEMKSALPVTDRVTARVSQPVITVGLGGELAPKFSAQDIFLIRKSQNETRPYLSDAAMQFATLHSLRDIAGTLNLWGLSGNDLIDDLVLKRGKNLENRIIAAGHQPEESLVLRKLIADMETDASIFFEEECRHGECCIVPIMLIKQRTIMKKALEMCGITGQELEITIEKPSTLEEVVIAAQDQHQPLDATQYDVLEQKQTKERSVLCESDHLSDLSQLNTGIHIQAQSELSMVGCALTSDKHIYLESKGLLSLSSKTKRKQQYNGYQDEVIRQSFEAQDEIIIASDTAIAMKAITAESKNGDIYTQAPVIMDEALDVHAMRQYENYDNFDPIHIEENSNKPVTSEFNAEKGNVNISAIDGALLMSAPKIKAKIIELCATQGVTIQDVYQSFSRETHQQIDGGFFGTDKDIQTFYQSVKSQGASFDGLLKIHNESGDVNLTNISAGIIEVETYNGVVNLFLGKEMETYMRCEKEKSLVWQSNRVDGYEAKRFSESQFEKLTVLSPSDVHVQLVKGKTSDILNRIALNGGVLTSEFLEELHKETHIHQEGPTAALAIIVAIAATFATMGAGSYLAGMAATASGSGTVVTGAAYTAAAANGSLLAGSALSGAMAGSSAIAASTAAIGTATASGVVLSTTGTIIATMTTAVFSSLASQAALALVSSKGDLGKASKMLASRNTMKNLGISALTAGFVGGGSLNPGATLMERVAHYGLETVGRAAAETIVTGKTDMASLARSAVAQVIGGSISSKIGEIYHLDEINGLTHKALTAFSGAISGVIFDGKEGIAAGAMGAVTAATVGEAYLSKDELKGKLQTMPLEKVQEYVNRAGILSRMVTATVCGLTRMKAEHTNTAMMTASLSLDNDYIAYANRTIQEYQLEKLRKEQAELPENEATEEEKAAALKEKTAKKRAKAKQAKKAQKAKARLKAEIESKLKQDIKPQQADEDPNSVRGINTYGIAHVKETLKNRPLNATPEENARDQEYADQYLAWQRNDQQLEEKWQQAYADGSRLSKLYGPSESHYEQADNILNERHVLRVAERPNSPTYESVTAPLIEKGAAKVVSKIQSAMAIQQELYEQGEARLQTLLNKSTLTAGEIMERDELWDEQATFVTTRGALKATGAGLELAGKGLEKVSSGSRQLMRSVGLSHKCAQYVEDVLVIKAGAKGLAKLGGALKEPVRKVVNTIVTPKAVRSVAPTSAIPQKISVPVETAKMTAGKSFADALGNKGVIKAEGTFKAATVSNKVAVSQAQNVSLQGVSYADVAKGIKKAPTTPLPIHKGKVSSHVSEALKVPANQQRAGFKSYADALKVPPHYGTNVIPFKPKLPDAIGTQHISQLKATGTHGGGGFKGHKLTAHSKMAKPMTSSLGTTGKNSVKGVQQTGQSLSGKIPSTGTAEAGAWKRSHKSRADGLRQQKENPQFGKNPTVTDKVAQSGERATFVSTELTEKIVTKPNQNPRQFTSDIFNSEPTHWKSPVGTKQTYKVTQRNDIDWYKVRTRGAKDFIGKTNLDAAKSGFAPQLHDGSFATLHHINQNGLGNLIEASTCYHGVGKYGQEILHSLYGSRKSHPINPVNRNKFSADTRAYWKQRVQD